MKKGIVFAILAALLLCGCSQKLPDPPSAAETVEFTEPQPPKEMIRPEKMEMEILLEGEPEVIPMTLYRNETYSIYIPDGDWSMTVLESGVTRWTSVYNPDVKLTIRSIAASEEALVRDTILQEYPGFVMVEDGGSEFVATDVTGQKFLAGRLIPMDAGFLGVTWTYSLEAAEGFGARLSYIVDTLLLEKK